MSSGASLDGARSVASQDGNREGSRRGFWKMWLFIVVVVADGVFSLVLLTPIVPQWRHARNEKTDHYTLYGSFLDLAVLAALRLLFATFGLVASFLSAKEPPKYPFKRYKSNGEKKTREELELEAMEEPIAPWLWRSFKRPATGVEFFATLAEIVAVSKCLSRMNVEIGLLAAQEPKHPLFWVVVLMTTLFSVVECSYMDGACRIAARYGNALLEDRGDAPSLLRTISSQMSLPLLADQDNLDEESPEEERGVSDIGPEAQYKVTSRDLLLLCKPELHLISVAFTFLLLAAIAQIYIPRYLGNILDALGEAFDKDADDETRHESMLHVPGFMRNIKMLIAASIAAGVFAGLRGSVFTVIGGRTNIRLRVQLMDSLFSQDIGFFDVTKTGDITSRLSSDTTLVGDQVMLNVNIFLRSLVQAAGVLLFMFVVSWQLSILAFISVPLITFLSKWYGNYMRSLSKLMQKKLADGNAVSEAALSSMATVRSFDAAEAELREFEIHMQNYLRYNLRCAMGYWGYAAFTTSIPQLVFAVVVFYGGFMVRNGDLTSGKLVSFLLYLQSLSDAFGSIGSVWTALTQALGAADKVFELMKREPRYKRPSVPHNPQDVPPRPGIMGLEPRKTSEQRTTGLKPDIFRGEIRFEDVELYYPARPRRRVLNGLTLKIEPGQIIALVGKSGGGKSSLMSLVQHLYEPSRGKVMLDGHEVHELAPEFLSRHISIVSQEPTLFARSIKRNIIFGLEGTDREPSDADVAEAAHLANAGFIYDFPKKFDTQVGERGVQLSRGQKQRIAIARALVRKPKILLLDEATSALDAESEHLVQAAIDDMIARGKAESSSMTVLIAAHRLSTVRDADKIFVISDGHVVEEGSHAQLLREKPDGAYAALIKRQLGAQSKLEGGSSASATLS